MEYSTKRQQKLENTITTIKQKIRSTNDKHDKALGLFGLGIARNRMYKLTGEEENKDLARRAYQASCTMMRKNY